MTIVTLIAADRLDERLLRAALARVAGARLAAWIDPGSAADLEVARRPPRRAPRLTGWEGVDAIAHPPGPREKRLFVADMDSTMIGQECIDELADYAGIKPQIAAITERAMQGELDFAAALRERVALLGGLEESAITLCLAERIRPNPGAATLVRTMRARGATTLLVSGGFTAFAGPVGGDARVRAGRGQCAGDARGQAGGDGDGADRRCRAQGARFGRDARRARARSRRRDGGRRRRQ